MIFVKSLLRKMSDCRGCGIDKQSKLPFIYTSTTRIYPLPSPGLLQYTQVYQLCKTINSSLQLKSHLVLKDLTLVLKYLSKWVYF